jgi:PAS domain S-box-containing protein
MKAEEELSREIESLRKRLKETEKILHALQSSEEISRRSEQEKMSILNSLHEAIVYLDADMRILWTNSGANAAVGLTPDEMLGRYCYEVWCQKGNRCADCPAAMTMRTGRPEEGEISSPDGKIWLHRSYPVQNAGGHVERVVATAIDVTERKEDEARLREHDQILDQIHDSIISTDLEGYVVTWNKGAERIFGYSAEEGLGKHISFVYPPDQHEFLQKEVIGLLKKEGRHEIEVRMRRKGGDDFYAHLSLSMLKDKEGREIGMIGSSVDVTERRQMEAALRRSREELERRVQERTVALSNANRNLQQTGELLEKLFSSIDVMIAYLDRDFTFLRVNRALAENDGRPPEFFIGKKFFDLFPNVDRENFRKVVETGQPVSGYGRPFIHPEHSERGVTYWDWSLQPVKGSDGRVAGVVSSFVDVTERRRAEEALKESERRLRFLSSQLITVQEQERKRVAGELHDGLGALLSGIKYKIEATLFQKSRNKLKAMEKQLESVVPMIQESLEEVRRIQTDLRPATLDNLGVLAALRGDCRRFQTTYPNVSIRQELEIGEEEVPDWLKIVLYRISQEALNNVAKHSGANLLHLSLRKQQRKINLVIEDDGRGFNVNEVLSRESSKRGFGLTSMRERSELSGGAFSIESTLGKGTIIRVSWPTEVK